MAKKNRDTGFTFLEVIISLVLLVTALSILLGLQTSLIDRAVIERQQREAMQYAREIFSAVEARETAGNPMSAGTVEGTPDDVLSAILSGAANREQEDATDSPKSVFPTPPETTVDVQYWGIPEVNEKAMKRIELRINWGPSAQERLQLLFFIPFDEDTITNADEDLNDPGV
ncbi:MAG: type II secretion system protein [Bdellovibrionales bacterium]|nr:type II secretion system protein [Bdellovibrionales bacterium]